jgi:tetratricopeptide (TPR) repeat protein
MVRFHLGDRYQSAQEVLKDLKSLGRGFKPQNGIVKWLKKDKKLLFIFSVFSIGFLAYIVWKLNRPEPPEMTLLISCKEKNERENYGEAEIDCQKSINIRPSKEAYLLKGNALNGQKKYTKAIADYNMSQKIANDKTYILPQVSIGQIYNNQKKYIDAESVCEKATNNNQNDFSGWSCLGYAQKDLQDYDRAKASFEQAIQLSCYPQNKGHQSPTDLNKGCSLNLYNKGETLMYQAEQLNPSDKNKAIQLLEEAIKEFQKAIDKADKYDRSKFEPGKKKAEELRDQLLKEIKSK